jgi:hypothetical protein
MQQIFGFDDWNFLSFCNQEQREEEEDVPEIEQENDETQEDQNPIPQVSIPQVSIPQVPIPHVPLTPPLVGGGGGEGDQKSRPATIATIAWGVLDPWTGVCWKFAQIKKRSSDVMIESKRKCVLYLNESGYVCGFQEPQQPKIFFSHPIYSITNRDELNTDRYRILQRPMNTSMITSKSKIPSIKSISAQNHQLNRLQHRMQAPILIPQHLWDLFKPEKKGIRIKMTRVIRSRAPQGGCKKSDAIGFWILSNGKIIGMLCRHLKLVPVDMQIFVHHHSQLLPIHIFQQTQDWAIGQSAALLRK